MSPDSDRQCSLRVWLALALFLVYAAPLFFPPPATPLTMPPWSAGLMERLFPGLPPWWVGGRLICLLAAAIIAISVPRRSLGWFESFAAGATASGSAWTLPQRSPLTVAAAVIVALQLVASLLAKHLPRPAQVLFILSLAAPAMLLFLAAWREAPHSATQNQPVERRIGWAIAAMIVLTVTWRLATAWSSPLVASITDATLFLTTIEAMLDEHANLLITRMHGTVPYLFLLLIGVGPLEIFGWAPTIHWVQATQCAWIAAVAAGIAWVTLQSGARHAAAVATAAYLFSPWTLTMPLFAALQVPVAFVPLALLALLQAIHVRRSVAALALFGPAAAVGLMQPGLVPFTLLAIALATYSVATAASRPRLVIGIAALSFVATLLPALPGAQMLDSLRTYTGGKMVWTILETLMFGQLNPVFGGLAKEIGSAASSDVIASVLIAPFAITRTPLRLLGDTLLAPLTVALFTLGIGLCLRFALHSRFATATLIAVIAVVMPAFVSSYDRPSFTRAIGMSVMFALIAAIGFEYFRRMFPFARGATVTAITVLAIAAGGIALADLVNP
ncbi:MAG TPA: hypothetical protein VEB21_02810, partial [Terriglobales bacterium]|nr:hypothetical protein [Terriglobales bacterium]